MPRSKVSCGSQARASRCVKRSTVRSAKDRKKEWNANVELIRAERAAYERNKEEILRKFEGQFIAMLNGKVIDHDNDYEQLAIRVYKRLGRAAVLLTRATREREALQIGMGLILQANK